ncbi:MMPL family transporter [Streptomyces phaeochromogenes]|uniref:MMPL family transporter n=1 Tax=Streptomyces phaeochromogenes TaxID=1923 RepID=UPI0033C57662
MVTAAALIMAAVFASFLFTTEPITKAIGFSFSAGVLIDAFVVRLTLVPAAMAIIGAKIWHHPRWYDRYIPTRTSKARSSTKGSPNERPSR